MNDLQAAYEQLVCSGRLADNSEQRRILVQFDQLTTQLKQPARWVLPWKKKTLKGIYLYGKVGVGKTFLMDLFYTNLTGVTKKRCHFHQFMQEVDTELRKLQGQKNPLQVIAEKLAQQAQVLCFDEFMVHDVAHAMILAELLSALFKRKVVLIATSNSAPSDLYREGTLRARFLPAITAIESNCELIELLSQRDYRLGKIQTLNAYLFPLTQANKDFFNHQFLQVAHQLNEATELIIQNRSIAVRGSSPRVVWFDFNVICQVPRSQLDYLEIANTYNCVFISNIPVLSEKNTMQALLLILLVDVFYDQGVRLFILAEVSIDALYTQGELLSDFNRTISRLHEMQAEDYIVHHPHHENLSHVH